MTHTLIGRWILSAAILLSPLQGGAATPSAPRGLRFAGTVFDMTPPTAAVISPANGASVGTMFNVTVSATDNVGVAGVRFYMDGSPVGAEDTTAPFAAVLSSVAEGPHTVTAVARDAEGNTSSATSVTVTMSAGLGIAEHPRIWLSPEELARLRAKVAANDPSWIALSNYCATHVNDTGYDVSYSPTEYQSTWEGKPIPAGGSGSSYRAFGYHDQIIQFALCHQALKDREPSSAAAYAAHAKAVMHGLVDSFSVGEEKNGLGIMRCGERVDGTLNAEEAVLIGNNKTNYKQGYTARTSGVALPIGYDWLYDTLTAEEKVKFYSVMFRWIDWYRGKRSAYNNGVLIAGKRYHEDQDGDCAGDNVCTTATGAATKGYSYGNVANNYQNGFFEMATLSPIAALGDTPDAQAYLDFITDYFNTVNKPALESPVLLKGGDSPEGWNYGSSWDRIIASLYALKTGVNVDYFTGFEWPVDFLKSYIHATASNLSQMVIHGEWTGDVTGLPYAGFVFGPTFILNKMYPSSNIGRLGRYYITHANFAYAPTPVNLFLWGDASIPEEGLSTEPLSYRATGTGLVTMRSSWTDSADVVFASAQLGGGYNWDHENYDEGNILMQRGADRLLVHQNMQNTSLAHNTVVFNNQSHHARNPVPASPPIDRIEETGEHLFVSADITVAWKREWNTDRCKLFRRNVLFLRPHRLVVYDVTQSNTALGNLKDWYTQYAANPTVSSADRTITATAGGSKVQVKTLYPTDGAFTASSPATGFWRVKYTPPLREYDQFLHLIEATDAAGAPAPASLLEGSGGRGVLIADASENTVAMFTSDPDAAEITALSYTAVTTGPSRHIIANLTPGKSYAVGVDAAAAKTYTASEAGIIEFVNASSGSHNYTVAP